MQRLGIVVVTHNSAQVVAQLLDDLHEVTRVVGAPVIVVDNGSTDNTLTLVASRPEVRLVACDNLGYAAGINRGVSAMGQVEAILVLNPDVRLDLSSVEVMLSALQQGHIGIVAPKVVSPDGVLQQSLRRTPTLGRALGLGATGLPVFSEYVSAADDYARAHEADWALGAALLISWGCWRATGGWDESYFLYSEETDFCLRAGDLGYTTWYEPGAIVSHIGGASGRSGATHAMQVLNRVRLYRRRHGILSSWLYFFLTLVGELSWLARGQANSWPAILAMLRPSLRPQQLGISGSILPR